MVGTIHVDDSFPAERKGGRERTRASVRRLILLQHTSHPRDLFSIYCTRGPQPGPHGTHSSSTFPCPRPSVMTRHLNCRRIETCWPAASPNTQLISAFAANLPSSLDCLHPHPHQDANAPNAIGCFSAQWRHPPLLHPPPVPLSRLQLPSLIQATVKVVRSGHWPQPTYLNWKHQDSACCISHTNDCVQCTNAMCSQNQAVAGGARDDLGDQVQAYSLTAQGRGVRLKDAPLLFQELRPGKTWLCQYHATQDRS